MKKNLILLATVFLAATLFTSCGDGFKTTKDGLIYKFLETNKGAKQVQMGDVLVGTCVMRLNDSVLITIDQPDRILMATNPAFKGDLPEGLLMMHIGDKAIFGVPADSLALLGFKLPSYYKSGTGMTIYYEINLTDIVTQEEIAQERDNYIENQRQIHEAEAETLAKYVADNNIKATPDEEGLYIIVNKKGKGQIVEINRNVAINYTGRLLNGKVFDTSIESIAKQNGIYDAERKYAPLSYTVGQMSLIRGWQKGIINQPAGSKLTLIIPSSMGYGPQGAGDLIPPNSPLIFDIEIVSVQ
ncbi:MAG: FKBP-type peptidyl-prolyl cis-trans isomerase [Bacteroidales bacterium]|nr:FKBP-type peptidyl-prolyl cis-trans isomerase [Bacteroidales bacterium]